MTEQEHTVLTAPRAEHPIHPDMIEFYGWCGFALCCLILGLVVAWMDRRDTLPRDQGD